MENRNKWDFYWWSRTYQYSNASMYNLIEYSDNCSDTSGSLWHFKRDEIEGDVDVTVDGYHIPNN